MKWAVLEIESLPVPLIRDVTSLSTCALRSAGIRGVAPSRISSDLATLHAKPLETTCSNHGVPGLSPRRWRRLPTAPRRCELLPDLSDPPTSAAVGGLLCVQLVSLCAGDQY